MNNIKKHIQNENYSRAYLLYGEEDYLRLNYRNMLRKAMVADDDMNYSYYEGKDCNLSEIADLSSTMPFFAERRLIMIENSGMLKSGSEEMIKIIKDAPETTFFVFTEKEVDKRNKLFKTISDVGYVCEFKMLKEDDIVKWVLSKLGKEGKRITRDNMTLLISRIGLDMNTVKNETDKIIAYTHGREEVTAEDINELCVAQLQDKVFDMIDAMAVKDKDKVIRLYSDLLALKEPQMKILVLLGKQFSNLMAVKEMSENGNANNVIAEKLGIRPFFVGKYIAQSKKFTLKQLREAMNDCIEADNSVKTGRTDDRYAAELIILKYCSL